VRHGKRPTESKDEIFVVTYRPRVGIGADHAAHEKITALELRLVFVDDPSDQQSLRN
jgi:hypothetical protein